MKTVTFKEKTCDLCLGTYTPRSGTQKYCDDCRTLKAAEYESKRVRTEKDTIRKREWYFANKERLNKKSQKYYRDHRDDLLVKFSIIRDEWIKNNPERVRENCRISAHRRRCAGKLTRQTLQAVYEDNIKKYGTLTCYLCEKRIEFGNDHLEHKMPISRGGTNDYDNLAVSCAPCNRSKGAKTEEEYRALKEQI